MSFSNTASKTAVFIDGSNLHATQKALQFHMDYAKLRKELENTFDLLRIFYYTAVRDTDEYNSIKPLVDWLSYHGYQVITKDTKEYVDTITGIRKIKGNMDIEIAVQALQLAEHVDHIILFSGDGDFRSLVEAIQRKGVYVSVVSSIITKPPMIADELRRQADSFVDLADLMNDLSKDRSEGNVALARVAKR